MFYINIIYMCVLNKYLHIKYYMQLTYIIYNTIYYYYIKTKSKLAKNREPDGKV